MRIIQKSVNGVIMINKKESVSKVSKSKNKTGKSKNMTNKLIDEKSPYLLQHAYNPVNWYPWGSEAFTKAEKEDKPIFLSIGYSTCHWCHVMEKESFEDPEVAKLMNEAFVSIKVDREERPDIDNIFMSVCHAITGSGGWPLTIIMTPEKKPFFAGTYIPKEQRFNQPGLKQLTRTIQTLWSSRRKELLESAETITSSLKQYTKSSSGGELEKSFITTAYEELSSRYDITYGGFGSAPKFPEPHILMFLLRYWKSSGNQHALEIVKHTLDYMHRGGMYDQIGFGFHRYSTDERLAVP